MRLLLAACAAVALSTSVSAQHHPEGDDNDLAHVHDTAAFTEHHGEEVAAALAKENREADRARDQYRHPAETLAFFHIGPHMKVGEYAPGGGWYSRVLGNYLNGEGRLVGLWRSADGAALDEAGRTSLRNGAAAFAGRMAEWTGRPDTGAVGYTLDAVPEAERGTFDRLLLIRMLHNMVDDGIAESELSRMHSLLKPGGMLGVVQHRAKANAPDDYADGSKGYLRHADVVALVESQGFELVGKSEINANLQDTADHPQGVWEMPPTLGTKREELKGLGESDRMTLLFRKR